MKLSLYIARRFSASFLLVFFGFFAVLYLIEMVDQIRRFSGAGLSLARTAELALLKVPESAYRILPMVMILASIALFLALARSSELVVIRAAGRSALRMLVSPLIAAVLIGAFAVAALNPIVAGTSTRYEALSDSYRLGDGNALSVSREGLWLRQSSESGQTVIHAARANSDGDHALRGLLHHLRPPNRSDRPHQRHKGGN